jgi:hypothetical protein
MGKPIEALCLQREILKLALEGKRGGRIQFSPFRGEPKHREKISRI